MTTLLCMVTQTRAFMNTYFLRTSWHCLISLICYWMDDVLCGLLLANGWVLTCPMSSRQLKMYFLASFDLILVSASCSSGDWKKEHKTASATERHTHVHIHRAQWHAHLPTTDDQLRVCPRTCKICVFCTFKHTRTFLPQLRKYSQLFKVLSLNARVTPCLALVGWVYWCFTKSFHTFSLNYFQG